MQFLRELQLSVQFYWRTLRFLDKNDLWSLLLVPAMLNLMLAVGIAILSWKTSDVLVGWLNEKYYFQKNTTDLQTFFKGLLLFGIRASIIFLYLKIFRYGVLILFSPLMAYISGRIQMANNTVEKEYRINTYISNCSRAVKIAIGNFFLELIITFLILFFSILITWLFPIAPLIILIFESYFFGYSMADYRNEFFNLSVEESKQVINEHKGLVIGNGLFFNLCLLIPLLGILFAPVFALVASGLSFNYVEKRKSILCPSDQSTLIMAK